MREQFRKELQQLTPYLPKPTGDVLVNKAVATVADAAGKKGKTKERFVVSFADLLSPKQISKLEGHLFHNHSLRMEGLVAVPELVGDTIRAGEVDDEELSQLGLLTQSLYFFLQRVSKKELRRIREEQREHRSARQQKKEEKRKAQELEKKKKLVVAGPYRLVELDIRIDTALTLHDPLLPIERERLQKLYPAALAHMDSGILGRINDSAGNYFFVPLKPR